MDKALVENQVCEKCGADVREGALFCYNCGSALSTEAAVASNGDSVSSGWFRENIADTKAKTEKSKKRRVTEKLKSTESVKIDRPITKPSKDDSPSQTDAPITRPLEALDSNEVEKSDSEEKETLKSAAELRRKMRIARKKKVEEIVWEEHENAPNLWFLLAALILFLLSFVIFYLAIFFK